MPFPFFTKRWFNNYTFIGQKGNHIVHVNDMANVIKDIDAIVQNGDQVVSPLLPTAAEKAALDASANPSASNPYATIADLPAPGVSFITGISNTGNDVTLSVTLGVLEANLASNLISQFTNDAGYITSAALPNLDAVLTIGNTTGGNDIVVTTGDQIIGQTDLLLSAAGGNNYYYAGPNYIFQQWYDPGPGDTDFLLQGGGTQLFSSTAIDIQCDTGLYGFYEGTAFNGVLDFTGLSANRAFAFPDNSGTIALTSDIPSVTPAALTRVDDTNVTLTLGGTPATALLQATSLTLGWTGTLADARITSAATWNAKLTPPANAEGELYNNGSGTLSWVPNTNYAQRAYAAAGGAILAEPITGGFLNVTTTLVMNNQQTRIVGVWIPKATTITGVKWRQATQGAYTANNYNGVALYSISAGLMTQVAVSTDDGNIWKATGDTVASKAFASTYSAQPGLYFIQAFYCSSAQVTQPVIGALPASASVTVETMDFTNSVKMNGVITQTSAPATLAMSSVISTNNHAYFALY